MNLNIKTAMKKEYITPAIGNMCMDISSLLMASVNSLKNAQADTDDGNDGAVNFSRQGSFWDETE